MIRIIVFILLTATSAFAELNAPPVSQSLPTNVNQYIKDIYDNFNVLETTDTPPDGNRFGRYGELVRYNNAGTYTVYTCVSSPQGKSWQPVITTHGVPAGGTTGQVLGKASNTDYDTTWLSTSNFTSLFSQYGGDGSQGAITVSGATNVSAIDDANRIGVIQATTLTIDAGQTLTVNTGLTYIGVQGTCTIHGTINANGRGGLGGTGYAGAPGTQGYAGANGLQEGGVSDVQTQGSNNSGITGILLSTTANSQLEVNTSLAGSGGGGGGGSSGGGSTGKGGCGGGSGGLGGYGAAVDNNGINGNITLPSKIIQCSGGKGDNATHSTYFNPTILLAMGGGGGGGYDVGGNGGGIIYIECDTLVFDGTLTANGNNGTDGAANEGGGGGGGGGVIFVRANTITTNTGTITVTGGTGGASGGGTAGTGGNGANGFKDIVSGI